MKICYHKSRYKLKTVRMNLFARSFVLCFIPAFLLSQYKSDSVATFIFTGDFCLAHRFEAAAQNHSINVFANWKSGKSVGNYDAMMVNLENAVTRSVDSVEKEFVFKMKPEFLKQLKQADISVVSCANNHAADFGEEGILETIRQLDSAGIQHIGIGRNFAEARRPVILNVNGIQIGFLGYGGVKDYIASRSKPGTTSRNESIICNDIKKLKPRVDVVVVNLHWGEELATEPDQSQIELAHRIIDSGADLIIGHHPHVLQGIEKYHGKVIAYSLGNFVFGGNANNANSKTAVLKVRFANKAIDVQALPVRVRNWQPERADSIIAHRVLQMLQERSKIFMETISFKTLGAKYE